LDWFKKNFSNDILLSLSEGAARLLAQWISVGRASNLVMEWISASNDRNISRERLLFN
jgi:hypothetical protein